MECNVQKRVEKMKLCGKHPMCNLVTKDSEKLPISEKECCDYLLLFDFKGDIQSVIANDLTKDEQDALNIGSFYNIKFRIIYNNSNRSSRIIIDSIEY